MVQALTIAVGVALGILFAGCIAVSMWWLVKRGYVTAVAGRVAAAATTQYGAIRRAWLRIILGSCAVVVLAFVGSPFAHHSPTTYHSFKSVPGEASELNDDFKAVLPDPTFSRSLQSSFENSVLGSSLHAIGDWIEALRNQNPVSDEEVVRRVSDEGLQNHILAFDSVNTQGELDTKIERLRRQLFNNRVGEAGGGQALVTDLIWGAACLALLLKLWRTGARRRRNWR